MFMKCNFTFCNKFNYFVSILEFGIINSFNFLDTMTSQNIKKRKYKQENRIFQKEWIENFAFIDNNEKWLGLFCKITIANYKI